MKKLGLNLTLAIAITITLLVIGIFYSYQNCHASGFQNNIKDTIKTEEKLKIDNELIRKLQQRVDDMEKWVIADEKNIDKWLKFLGLFLSIVIAASIYNGLRASSLAKEELEKIREKKDEIKLVVKDAEHKLKSLDEQMIQMKNKVKEFEDDLNQKVSDFIAFYKKELNKMTEKELSNLTLKLLKMIPTNQFAPSSEHQWIYENTCLVHDYKIEGKSISSDTYCDNDGWQIQLFGRNKPDQKFLFEVLGKVDGFLPMSFEEYEKKDERLIFKKLPLTATVEEVAQDLKLLLSKIEAYKSQNPK